jgi:hypothetical protein
MHQRSGIIKVNNRGLGDFLTPDGEVLGEMIEQFKRAAPSKLGEKIIQLAGVDNRVALHFMEQIEDKHNLAKGDYVRFERVNLLLDPDSPNPLSEHYGRFTDLIAAIPINEKALKQYIASKITDYNELFKPYDGFIDPDILIEAEQIHTKRVERINTKFRTGEADIETIGLKPGWQNRLLAEQELAVKEKQERYISDMSKLGQLFKADA